MRPCAALCTIYLHAWFTPIHAVASATLTSRSAPHAVPHAIHIAGSPCSPAALHLIHLLMFDDQAATQRTVYRWGSWLHHTEPVNTGHSASRLAQVRG